MLFQKTRMSKRGDHAGVPFFIHTMSQNLSLMAKKIYSRHYQSEEKHLSDLNYEKELRGSRLVVDGLKKKNPKLTDDEALVLWLNLRSSYHIYSIEEED
jgi:hypothetical protein